MIRHPQTARVSRCAIVLVIAVASTQPLLAKLSYDVWLVDTSYATHDPIVVDVDGDGLKDLVVPQYAPTTGRELHIYKQTTNQKLSASPVKVEIKSEIIGFSMADVREEAGTEIVWITENALYSLSANLPGYVGNIEHLVDWKLLVRHPDSKELLYVEGLDINSDGARDLVLPGTDRYGILLNRGSDGFELAGSIEYPKPVESDEIPEREYKRSLVGETVGEVGSDGQVHLTSTFFGLSQYHGLFSQIDPDVQRTRSITDGSWQPGVLVRDINGDGLMDLVYRTRDGLNISHLRSDETVVRSESPIAETQEPVVADSFNLVGYEVPMPGWRDSSFEDIDGDGDLDIVSIDNRITSSTVRLLRNDSGRFDAQRPTQVLRVNGAVIGVEFASLYGGAEPVMVVNTVTAPVRKILAEIELNRNLLLFARGESGQGVYQRKPSVTLTTSINIDSFRNLMPTTLRIDLNSDGVNDLVGCNSDGTVQAWRLDESLQLDTEAFWQFTPEYAVFAARAEDLNSDQVPDLILRHSTAMTYLISR